MPQGPGALVPHHLHKAILGDSGASGVRKAGGAEGLWGFPGGSAVKSPPAVQETQERRAQSLGREDRSIPGRRAWQPTPVFFLPGESHGPRSLAGYGRKESHRDSSAFARPQRGSRTPLLSRRHLLPCGWGRGGHFGVGDASESGGGGIKSLHTKGR